MALRTIPFDPAEGIETAEDVAFFLEAAFEDADAAHIANALGVVARSRGMTGLAEKTGLSRAALYKALSEAGNPSLETLLKVLDALGMQLTVKPVEVV
ncbi:MAG: addiction module antidote protein [Phenylobacterium sp.]|nr:addiction module antidote protein [Phenylobacterium sp.]